MLSFRLDNHKTRLSHIICRLPRAATGSGSEDPSVRSSANATVILLGRGYYGVFESQSIVYEKCPQERRQDTSLGTTNFNGVGQSWVKLIVSPSVLEEGFDHLS